MTLEEFEAATGFPLDEFACQCHAASLALVKSGVLGESRVARGWCVGVGSQHSWVVLGKDCYAPDVKIIDPTLWSYTSALPYIWEGQPDTEPFHVPHGAGSIWEWGRPVRATETGEPPLVLDALWSEDAERFLEQVWPLGRRGWAQLAHAPVGGWPAAEIIGAMYDDPRLQAIVPIDIVGMLTDRNPGGLYLPEGATDAEDH